MLRGAEFPAPGVAGDLRYRSSMWELRSVAIRTDLFVTRFDGEVIDRGRYVVVRTPSNPHFRWGNYLVYPEPPDATSHPVWLEDHARELPGLDNVLLAWDRPDGARGEVDAFLRDGFEVDDGTTLTITTRDLVVPPRHDPSLEIAPIASDAHWDAAARVLTDAYAARPLGSVEGLRSFVVLQLARYRAMQERGLGQWYGAFAEGELAGVLGLVRVDERGLGRFQLVGTDPRFARRGVCSTLVHEVARRALHEQGLETLVMAADSTYHAAHVYESVGFRPTERLYAVMRTRSS